MRYVFQPVGTCSTGIAFDLKGGFVVQLRFTGGCQGNLEALSRLVAGRRVDEIIPLLRGIVCQNGTSCLDQLALALSAAREGGPVAC